jgi:hypothetical protein
MAWGYVGAAAVGVVGGIIASDSSRSASNKQTDAINAASGKSDAQFQATMERDKPLVEARNQSLEKMRSMLGIGTTGANPTAAVTSDPGYQFGLKTGADQRTAAMNARGMRNSGAMGLEMTRYGNDYATTKFDNSFNRLASVAQLGQVGASSINQAGQNNANTVGNNLISAGNVAATNSLAQGNIYSGVGNQLAGWYANNNKPAAGGSSPSNAQLEQQYYFGGP